MEMYNEEMMTETPKVWLIRAQYGSWTEAFVNNGYIGIHYNLDAVDMSDVKSVDEVRQIYAQENPSVTSPHSIGNRAGQIGRFHLETKSGDFVLTPGAARDEIWYGRFSSDSAYYTDGSDGLPCRNRKSVDWSSRKLSRGQLPSNMTNAQRTVTEIRDEVSKATFFELIGEDAINSIPSLKMPEDSWVPFHLEVGRKLIGGEWWREEKRDQFAQMIDDIRNADPEVGDSEYARWSPDPFSFYLSFNMRTVGKTRLSAYRKVKELLDIDAEVPEERHEARGLGIGWGWEPPIDDAELSFLWEFFRLAMEFKPSDTSIDTEEWFIAMYDRAASASFLRGMRGRVLSYWLYWIDPTKYLLTRRLREEELGLIADFPAILRVSEDLARGIEYVKALGAIQGLGNAFNFSVLDVNRLSTTRETLGLDEDIDHYEDDDYIEEETITYTVDDALDDALFFERDELERILARFEDNKNLILQGPPGVGKTFVSKRLAYALMRTDAPERVWNVQFHQSYSYEEFVQGYRPTTNANDELKFELRPGAFLRLCEVAREHPNSRFVMVIDEINRGNLSRVFGELLSLIEKDKRSWGLGKQLSLGDKDKPDESFSVELLGGEEFSVPENVYILGTMNLADRSLAGMDYAMRRRFAFVTLEPQFGETVFENWLRERDVPDTMIERINSRMSALNDEIAGDASLGRNFAVGHSYFCDVDSRLRGNDVEDWDRWYRNIVETEIQPLLEEYWFDNLDKADEEVGKLLGEQ